MYVSLFAVVDSYRPSRPACGPAVLILEFQFLRPTLLRLSRAFCRGVELKRLADLGYLNRGWLSYP